MEMRPSKIRKKEGSVDESCNSDPQPQNVQEPQPPAQPSQDVYPEADTLQDFLQSKPTEADIRTHVCQKAGDKWPAVCTYLGVHHSTVQMARGNNPHQGEDACFEAVMHWRSGNTRVSVTWAGLLDALKSASLGDVANSLLIQNGLGPLQGYSMQGGLGAPFSVEVHPVLPEPLQDARRLAYNRYQWLSTTEGLGPRKLQFTKVAVLETPPKAREKGDLDQGEFLKLFRDCSIRLSEGTTNKQVTVDHFLVKGPQQTRIVYGQPGTGKTTFLKYLCQKVAADGKNSDFSLVLFFPLRDKAISQALKDDNDAGLEQLLRYYIRGKKCSASTEALLESEGENVLMIFDGADELHSLMDSSEGSLLGALLEGRLLPQAHIIVSTRPGGCPLLQEHSALFYEILGFDEESVDSFVKDFFENKPDTGKAMLSDLKARPDLMGGVYIPMNLLIFCSIYEHGVAGKSAFPPTMTECYRCSIAKAVVREKQKVKKTSRVDPSLTDLPPDVKHLFSSLGDLAFKGLTQQPPDYIFHEDEVRHVFHATVRCDEILEDSTFAGLLHLHPDQDGSSSTLNFSHTTKQEYFAAYHLSLLPEVEQAAFWRENNHNPRFAVVLKFFAGLTRFKSAEVNEAIFTTVGEYPSNCYTRTPYLLYLFHALFESQNESLSQSIATQLNSSLTFDLYLTPFDTMALRYCLTKCKHMTELNFSSVIYSFPPTSFHHIVAVAQCNNLLQSLTLCANQFSTEESRALFQAARSLKKFILTVKQDCTSAALVEAFDHRCLEKLDLILYNDICGESSILEEKVANSCLKSLKLVGGSTVLNGVKGNCSIADLAVSDWFPRDETPSTVATCVQTMQQLGTLYIGGINPLPVLEAIAHRVSPLQGVKMWAPHWDRWCEEDWVQLEQAAIYAKVIKVDMDVGDSDRGSRALAAGFCKNSILREVKLTCIPEVLVESVRRTLHANSALTVTL